MLSQRVECCLSFTSSAFASLGGMHPALLSRLSPSSKGGNLGKLSTEPFQNAAKCSLQRAPYSNM